MWCGKCQSDVAAEVSPDNQRVSCATCGALLSTIDAPPSRPTTERLSDRTKDARELLQRWSNGNVIDPFGPPTRIPNTSSSQTSVVELASAQDVEASKPIATRDVARPTIPTHESPENTGSRIASTPTDSMPPSNIIASSVPGKTVTNAALFEQLATPIANPLAATNEPVVTVGTASLSPFVTTGEPSTDVAQQTAIRTPTNTPSAITFRVDSAHPADHFTSRSKTPIAPSTHAIGPFASMERPVETKRETKRPKLWFPTWDPAVWRSEPTASGSWSSMAGQFLAYAGVLGMTAGACLVVWSYFGGPTNYAPTGWLLATAGQMLLFFGVVTLVSGGLEQTTEQVNKRIEQLGDHIIRIEQAARDLNSRGGSVPPAHFENESDAAAMHRSAVSGYERSVVEE